MVGKSSGVPESFLVGQENRVRRSRIFNGVADGDSGGILGQELLNRPASDAEGGSDLTNGSAGVP